MAKPLRMQVLLGAIDQATGPLRKITQGSDQTARALRASRDELRTLERAQRDMRGFTALKRSSEQTATALQAQQRQVRELTQQIRQADGPTRQLTRQRDAAIRKARELKQQYEGEQRELQRLRGSMRDVSGVTGSLGNQQRELAQRVRNANQQLEQHQNRLRRVAEQQRRAAQASQAYSQSMGRVNRMAGVGAAGVGSGLAKGYAASRLLTPGVSWAEQMSTLQAVGRFSADDERYQALRAQSRELGGSTAFSATEVGAGQEFLLRAGMSAEAIQASMRDVLDLALANNTELGRAADIASNIAGAFKIDLEQEGSMSRVADILSGAASRANVNLEMLGETMKYLGGAEDLNLTMEQAAAMAGLLGNIGIQGSQAGTTMRAMMNRLTAPTSTAAGLMESYGIQVADVNGNMRDMPDILRDINAATAELGNVERKEVLQRIFGAEAGSGMAELVNSMAAGELDQLIAALGESYGENAEMARVMADNIGGDLKNMRSAWEEVGISVTDTNNGPLRELVQTVTRILRGVGDWIKANPELAGTIAKLAAGLIALVTIGGAITLSLASILGPLVMLRYGFALLAINGGGLIGTLVRLAGVAIPAVLAAVKGMAVFLATNPIGLAVAAIAAAVFLIIKYWEPISGFFRNLWNGVTELFGNAWQAIQEAFTGGIASVSRLLLDWSPMGILWRGITAGLQSMGVEIPERFSTLGNAMIDGLMAGIDAKWQALKDKVGSLTDGVTGWFRDALGINSPSRVFAEYGGFTVDGFNVGLDRQRDEPAKRVRDIARRVATAGAGIAIGTAGLPAVADIPIDRRPALSAQAPAAPTAGDTITIHVYGAPGMNERTLAQEVARQLEQRERQRAARQRSSLRDID
ncbi:phage tail tape measure protein [Halomonas daqingensis]|uniref:phage tail tape measure protein n=1 Tax=Billgrantia desiderata TaxID=52021 RepID=UPI001F1EB5ED|nr:phage tail tape measure protein [Halomonas desiderata]